MTSTRHLLALTALAALGACTKAPSADSAAPPDLSKKARVVTFDVSGMT